MVSSLVRPATNLFVDEFVRRAQEGSCAFWHDRLRGVLDETHGIMTYQEDVSKVAMALADFPVEDADQLRKIISKKHKERQLHDYYQQFCRGAERNGASPETIDRIWKMIMSFAGYSFCKPHSASYAQVSFKSAYLRAHYPAEFIAAVISNQGGYYSTFAYLSEARRMGLTILPPDFNASDWAYTGSGQTVRVGFMQIKGLEEAFAKRIVAERQAHGPFRSLADFLHRLTPDREQATLLIQAGCCDSIAGELTRPALLWRLFASFAEKRAMSIPIPPEYTFAQRLALELKLFGFPLSCHPLGLFADQLARIPHIEAKDLPHHIGKDVTLIGWLVTEKVITTKKGEPMEFLTLEDRTALYDAAVFPDLYRRVCHLLATNHAYIVTGLVEQQFSTVTLTVKDIRLLTSRYDEPSIETGEAISA